MDKLVALNADMARELRGVAVMSVPTRATSPGLGLRQDALAHSLTHHTPAKQTEFGGQNGGRSGLYRRYNPTACHARNAHLASSAARLCLTQSPEVSMRVRQTDAQSESHSTVAHHSISEPCRAMTLVEPSKATVSIEETKATPVGAIQTPLSATSSLMLSKRARDADAADTILTTPAAELKARHRLTLQAAVAAALSESATRSDESIHKSGASDATATKSSPISPHWRIAKVLVGHQGWVWALAVDPTNTWFVSGGFDTVIKVWDLSTGALRLNLTGHKEAVRSLALSSISPYLFSASDDHSVKCWDLERNETIRDFFGHKSAVHCVCTHPALDVVVSASRDRTVRVWDIRTRAAVHTFTGHTDSVMSLLTQSWEPQIVSGGSDGMIYLWDLVAGRARVRLTRHKKPVRGLALDVAATTLVSCGADDIRVWDLPSGEYRHTASTIAPMGSMSGNQSSSSRAAAAALNSASSARTLRIVSRAGDDSAKQNKGTSHRNDKRRDDNNEHHRSSHSTTIAKDHTPHEEYAYRWSCCAMSPRNVLAVGSQDGQLALYDWRNYSMDNKNGSDGCDGIGTERQSSEANKTLWTSALRGAMVPTPFQFTRTRSVPGTLPGEGGINSVVFDASGTRMITGESDKSVKIWTMRV